MALENVMRVDGGHIVTGGGAGESSVEIDWEDWCELTPEEQETGDWTIINCPWADGNVSVDLMTKLWENLSPTATFAGQSVAVANSDYDFLMIGFNPTAASRTVYQICPAIGNSILSISWNTGTAATGATSFRRNLTASTTSVVFADGKNQYTGMVDSTENAVVIPVVIYGIKLTATVKINAIAMDVSTSADKCMLSENESVKDRLDAHTIDNDFHDISSYIYNNGTYNDYTAPSDGYVVFKYAANSEGGIIVKTDTNNHITMATTKELIQSVFVKKGTQFCFGSTPSIGRFYSFI